MYTKSIITDIDSKVKATRMFTLKDLFFIIFYFLIGIVFRDRVNEYFVIPYILFNGIVPVFLILPSSHNKKRNNLESICLLFKKDYLTYRPYIKKHKLREDV